MATGICFGRVGCNSVGIIPLSITTGENVSEGTSEMLGKFNCLANVIFCSIKYVS